MKVLFDECVPAKFKRSFARHDCKTVPEAGFAGKSNGELLDLAEREGFNVFLTLDKGIEYEQNPAGRRIAIIIVLSKSNRIADLLCLVAECAAARSSIRPGQLLTVK